MAKDTGPWGPPTGPVYGEGPVEQRGHRRRWLGAIAAVLAIGAVASTEDRRPTVATTAEAPQATEPMVAAAPTVAQTSTTAATTTEAPTTVPTTTIPTTTTAVPTGATQACDELHLFVDTDGDTWGDCAPDVEGAHVRSQAIVAYLGYRELTCLTDQTDASTVCEAEAQDGSVHEVAIAITGDLAHDVVVRPAPTTTAAPLPPPRPIAQLPNDCDPNYSGCVPIDSDVDCAGGSGNGPSYASGPVRVIGSDVYGLDRDHDGVGCE